jgi:hypothetical protein
MHKLSVFAGSDGEGEQSLSNMFFEAKTKGISEDSYADWQAIVAKECETDASRNYSFKASKRIFRIEHARGDFVKAKATFERLVSFIPGAEANAVRKAFLNRKQAKNLLHVLCPKLNLVPYMRKRGAVEKSDAEMPFILSLHEILLKAVESKRSTYERCPRLTAYFCNITSGTKTCGRRVLCALRSSATASAKSVRTLFPTARSIKAQPRHSCCSPPFARSFFYIFLFYIFFIIIYSPAGPALDIISGAGGLLSLCVPPRVIPSVY